MKRRTTITGVFIVQLARNRQMLETKYSQRFSWLRISPTVTTHTMAFNLSMTSQPFLEGGYVQDPGYAVHVLDLEGWS